MKYIKSFIIGFLLATSIFLFIGASSEKLGSNPFKPMYVKVVEWFTKIFKENSKNVKI